MLLVNQSGRENCSTRGLQKVWAALEGGYVEGKMCLPRVKATFSIADFEIDDVLEFDGKQNLHRRVVPP